MGDSFPVVATLAFSLSVISLGWQVIRAWWDRPVIMITAQLAYRFAPGTDLTGDVIPAGLPMGWESAITVTNVGDRAVTVTDAGWWHGPGTHWERIERPPGLTERFPIRLEPNDQARLDGFMLDDGTRWLYGNLEIDRPDGPRQAARPFIEYVRRPSRWRLHSQAAVKRLYAPARAIERDGL